ncbi:hypothetical protein MKEN_00234400 [Mycena kentingensis (nom. inval.)]|nr:hypothetical protein MKEN_00234400 [Mycena kentingensis (nom. inval.)]
MPAPDLPSYSTLLNTPPASLQQMLSKFKSHRDTLTSKIVALRAELSQATIERDTTDNAILELCSALSPIHRMPHDILYEIFSWMIPDGWGCQPAPWYLGHISHSLRMAALAFPPLWAQVMLRDHHGVRDLSRSRSRLAEHLLRSGNSLLTVNLSWSEKSSPGTGLLLEMIVSHCVRWKKLAFTVNGNAFDFEHRMAAAKGQLPHLHAVHNISGRTIPLKMAELFLVAPKLHHVLLNDQGGSLLFPWKQISRAYFEGEFTCWLRHLPQAHNLQHLVLNLESEAEDPSQRVLLPNLRCLKVSVWGLTYVTAPHLEYLKAAACKLPEALAMLLRSECRLKLLCIRDSRDVGPVDVEDLVSVLRAVPTLASFLFTALPLDDDTDWYDYELNDLFIELAARDAASGQFTLVPHLSTFVFGLHQNPFDDEAFATMAGSRMAAPSPHRLARLVIEDVHDSAPIASALAIEWVDAEYLETVGDEYF